jgi:hypothetical protein
MGSGDVADLRGDRQAQQLSDAGATARHRCADVLVWHDRSVAPSVGIEVPRESRESGSLFVGRSALSPIQRAHKGAPSIRARADVPRQARCHLRERRELRGSGGRPRLGRCPALSTICAGSWHDAFPMRARDSAPAGPGVPPTAGPRPSRVPAVLPDQGPGLRPPILERRELRPRNTPAQEATSAGGTPAAPGHPPDVPR